jgi:hypothetical protein
MRALMIEAKSLGSARGIYSGLSQFQPELIGSNDEGYLVSVEIRADRQIVDILGALGDYLTQRDDGPARVEFDGRHYTMNPEHLEMH